MAGLFELILVHYRWIFVIFFLFPLSTLYDAFYYLRCKLIFLLFTNPKHHEKRVKNVQKQVRQWNDSGSTKFMCTARPGWQTMSFRQGIYKNHFQCIEINLMDVLEIDTDRKVIKVEPLVTIGQITSILNPMGWTLQIVPELDDLTIGGMINGTGIETSSHKYGLFQHICVAFELVLADGSVVKCSKEENSDLFYSVPWSHGTLGFLVSAEIRIIPAKPYVRIEYIPAHKQEEIVKIFTEEVNKVNENDFVEGLVYSKDTAVIMVANMTDEFESEKLNEIGNFYKPWFFTYAEKCLKNGKMVEYIPLRDYYHRHSRSIFWQIQDIIPFGNNILFRWLCGWMIPPKVSFLKITTTKTIKEFYENNQFLQDILVPLTKLEQTLNFFDKKLKIYPVWLCPHMLPNDPGMIHPHGDKAEMYVDFGLYGTPKVSDYNPQKDTRDVEEYTRSVYGHQMLYADTYQTREEFRQMFDHRLYDVVRKSLNCKKAFPNVYDKINKSVRQ